MGKPYSNDLRERVVAAIEAGHTRVEVAPPPLKGTNLGFTFRIEASDAGRAGPEGPQSQRA
jgi:hypothetical protein